MRGASPRRAQAAASTNGSNAPRWSAARIGGPSRLPSGTSPATRNRQIGTSTTGESRSASRHSTGTRQRSVPPTSISLTEGKLHGRQRRQPRFHLRELGTKSVGVLVGVGALGGDDLPDGVV